MAELSRTILIVEDNAGDVRLMHEALAARAGRGELHVLRNGEEAIAFLRRQGQYVNAPQPDLIFLDLNMPRMNGMEVLRVIKTDRLLQTIPVVVWTSSAAEADVIGSYQLHANCFVSKPVELEDFMLLIQSVEKFWLSVVTLPRRDLQ